MVGTCANPGCSAKFLYLDEGKLFAVPSANAAVRYVWLCGNCVQMFGAAGKHGDGVSLVRGRSRYCKPAVRGRNDDHKRLTVAANEPLSL